MAETVPDQDLAWSRVFGSTELGMHPLCATAVGAEVWVGGDFTGHLAGMPEGTYNRVAH